MPFSDVGTRSITFADGPSLSERATSRMVLPHAFARPRDVDWASYSERMALRFEGEIWYWRGPSPFHFVTVPEPESAELHDMSSDVSYGWGMIPVTATLGCTTWTTSLFPKDGGYVLPVKDKVRTAEELDVGDIVKVRMEVTTRARPGR